MKYTFEKKDKDTTILKYKDKEFEIKRDIELQAIAQGVYSKAKTKMWIELTKQGLKRDDLIITTYKDGKKYEDVSNLAEIEKGFVEQETLTMMDDVCKKYFDMGFLTLINDIGLDQNNFKEVEDFTTDLSLSIKGDNKSPSGN